MFIENLFKITLKYIILYHRFSEKLDALFPSQSLHLCLNIFSRQQQFLKVLQDSVSPQALKPLGKGCWEGALILIDMETRCFARGTPLAMYIFHVLGDAD